MANELFKVDIKGFRALQAGKPKWMIVRELVANALDEEISECIITLDYERGKATITVEDDSPEGFVDLAHAYTLFADTRKRSNVKVRGRFNLGEKQVIVLCDYARIISTKGAVEFDVLNEERTTLRKKREKGSEVMVIVRMKKEEFKECVEYCNEILSPKSFIIVDKTDNTTGNGFTTKVLNYKKPYKVLSANLKTEIKDSVTGDMQNVTESTDVHLHKLDATNNRAFIYELGIPICEIECDYSIDIQQKVPLSADRDKVDGKYLKTVYGEVLNETFDEISESNSSNSWVREGFASERSTTEARKEIIEKRFGEKALIANPFDKRSMDEAKANGYNIIHGSYMSKEEWGRVNQDELLVSTSSVFKTDIVSGRNVKPNENQKDMADFCKKVAKTMLNLDISVSFYESPEATVRADYSSESNQLRFNVSHIENKMWKPEGGRVCQKMLDLIIHELGHSRGWHTDHSYHECITELGSKLTIKAIENPEWFTLGF